MQEMPTTADATKLVAVADVVEQLAVAVADRAEAAADSAARVVDAVEAAEEVAAAGGGGTVTKAALAAVAAAAEEASVAPAVELAVLANVARDVADVAADVAELAANNARAAEAGAATVMSMAPEPKTGLVSPIGWVVQQFVVTAES